jgi:hypothetical protein
MNLLRLAMSINIPHHKNFEMINEIHPGEQEEGAGSAS